jgi:hypothetical protein
LGEVRQALDKSYARSLGLDAMALKRATRPLGYNTVQRGGRNAENYLDEFAQWGRANRISGEKDLKAALDRNDQTWGMIDNEFDKKVASLDPKWSKKVANDLALDPEIGKLIEEQANTDLADFASKTIAGIAKQGNLKTIRSTLGNIAQTRAGQNATPTQKLEAQLALKLKNKIDDYVSDSSGVAPEIIQQAKTDYKFLQPFMAFEGRDAFKLGGIAPGPGTAEKLLGYSLIGGGGLAGLGAGGENGVDPGAVATGLIGGALARKGLTGAFNKLTAKGGALAGRALANNKVKGVLEGLAQKSEQIPGQLPVVASGIASDKVTEGNTEDVPQLETQNPEDNIVKGENASENQIPEISPRLQNVLRNKLGVIYETEYADQLTPEEFIEKVKAKTKNFSDQASLATFLFDTDKDRESYIRQINAYKDLKNVDLDKALKGRGGVNIPILGNIGGDEESGNAYDMLANTVLNLKNEGDLTKRTPAQEKQLRNTVELLRKNPEMMQSFLQGTGLDFKQLKDLGVI